MRKTNMQDIDSVFELYRRVAKVPGGIARLESEISKEYVANFLSKAEKYGLSLLEEDQGKVIGEIHAYSLELFCFSHVLSELTIAVCPNYQGSGIGRRLFEAFIDIVVKTMPHIIRIELITRESNVKALKFYESLGLIKEGRLISRIKNLDGSLESDIPMG